MLLTAVSELDIQSIYCGYWHHQSLEFETETQEIGIRLVINTKHNLLYLEYAEQQNDAKHHHEKLSADDGEVGDLDTCKE